MRGCDETYYSTVTVIEDAVIRRRLECGRHARAAQTRPRRWRRRSYDLGLVHSRGRPPPAWRVPSLESRSWL